MPAIKANGINIYYETHGKGQPLVLIAGFSQDHTSWVPVLDAFAQNYQVTVFDNRGIAQTDCPDCSYTVEMMTDDVAALCTALELQSCFFIGSSMGGMMVQNLAFKYPQLMKAGIISCGALKCDVGFSAYTEARYELIKMKASPKLLMQNGMGWVFSSEFLNRPGIVDFLIEKAVSNPYPFTEVGCRNQKNALLSFNSEPWVNKINVPCLVVSGEEDRIFAEKHQRYMASLIPKSQYYCFKNIGHAPHIEQPDEFVKLTQGFFASLK